LTGWAVVEALSLAIGENIVELIGGALLALAANPVIGGFAHALVNRSVVDFIDSVAVKHTP
jgi:hypothetical protein